MIIFDNDPAKLLNIGSKFGPRVRLGNTFHNGIDFKVPFSTPLLALADGTVVVSRVHPKGILQEWESIWLFNMTGSAAHMVI